MAVINRNTLVLTGVSVVRDVVTVTMGNGLNSASAQRPASPISTRHLSQRYPQAEQANGQRHYHDAIGGVDHAADWAGRPLGCDGFLASRSPAFMAGLAQGGTCPTAAWRFGSMMAKTMAPVGKRLPGHLPSFGKALRISRLQRLDAKQGRKPAKAMLAWLTPAGRALATSTRG
jgi:hypothetical protein